MWTSILSRGYTIKGSGMRFNLERTRRPERKVGGGVPRRQRGLMGLDPSTKSQLPSLRTLTQTNHGSRLSEKLKANRCPIALSLHTFSTAGFLLKQDPAKKHYPVAAFPNIKVTPLLKSLMTCTFFFFLTV